MPDPYTIRALFGRDLTRGEISSYANDARRHIAPGARERFDAFVADLLLAADERVIPGPSSPELESIGIAWDNARPEPDAWAANLPGITHA